MTMESLLPDRRFWTVAGRKGRLAFLDPPPAPQRVTDTPHLRRPPPAGPSEDEQKRCTRGDPIPLAVKTSRIFYHV